MKRRPARQINNHVNDAPLGHDPWSVRRPTKANMRANEDRHPRSRPSSLASGGGGAQHFPPKTGRSGRAFTLTILERPDLLRQQDQSRRRSQSLSQRRPTITIVGLEAFAKARKLRRSERVGGRRRWSRNSEFRKRQATAQRQPSATQCVAFYKACYRTAR